MSNSHSQQNSSTISEFDNSLSPSSISDECRSSSEQTYVETNNDGMDKEHISTLNSQLSVENGRLKMELEKMQLELTILRNNRNNEIRQQVVVDREEITRKSTMNNHKTDCSNADKIKVKDTKRTIPIGDQSSLEIPVGLKIRSSSKTHSKDDKLQSSSHSFVSKFNSMLKDFIPPWRRGHSHILLPQDQNEKIFQSDRKVKAKYSDDEGMSLTTEDLDDSCCDESGNLTLELEECNGVAAAANDYEEENTAIFADPSENQSFRHLLFDRAGWLVGLLVLQSMSSFILEKNEGMLQKHLVIVNFLTMLVGAGGNAGNQASVRVIRGLAVGTLNSSTIPSFLRNEALMALCLSIILGISGFVRAAMFRTPPAETFAITASLFMIVVISIGLGSLLPLGMKKCGIDPAHSSTTIQVLMDILGVSITCWVCTIVLQSGFL